MKVGDVDGDNAGSMTREAPSAGWLGRSPLTDPRALMASLVVHVALVVVASVVAFRAASPRVIPPANGGTMTGELGPVDNRAPNDPGGGGLGEPEGQVADVSAESGRPTAPTRDPAADALISEILPTRDRVETSSPTLPGPSTSGLGMLSAGTSGESGGQGGGSGGGSGASVGVGTEFFGMREVGGSFAYVIDCSGSMTARGSLEVAKRELIASLGRLPTGARFAVIFYNMEAKVLADESGRVGMMAATDANKARVKATLATIEPNGGTDHELALRAAFALHPEVIFFLTDADLMTRQDVTQFIAEAGKTRIQAIEFGQVTSLAGSAPLMKLAKETGGSYRYVNVNTFGR